MAAHVKKTKPSCKYGNNCYRRNPQHLRDYSHPVLDEEIVEDKADLKTGSSDDDPKPKKQQRTIQDFFNSSDNDKKKANKLEESLEGQRPSKRMRADSQETTPEETEVETISSSAEAQEEECEDSLKDDASLNTEPPVYPDDVRECIKETFLLEMPEDFYQFWDFCKQCNKLNPRYALKKSLNLCLSGPFDILSGRHKNLTKNKQGRYPNFLLHQRFYYDPPEFQTVLVSEEDNKFHIGYFRDDPSEMPVFMASNTPGAGSASKEKLVQCGDNIFAAVHIHATQLLKTEKGERKKLIEQLIQSLEKEAKKLNLSLAPVTKTMKERQKKVNCPTFHGAGMVVPVDDNEVGYRPVPETQKDLKAMLKRLVEGDTETKREQASEALQEIITFIQFANDECDYGEGLELGLCLFSYGSKELHSQISFLMPLAYQLLNRPQFQEIIEAHLKCRRGIGENVDELQV